MAKQKVEITSHVLVPKHELLSDKQKEALLKEYGIKFIQLPKISEKDPAVGHLKAKPGDVIRITRSSPTSRQAIYYRGVVNE